MILIADSGSTKTDWCAIKQNHTGINISTQGINPFQQDEETIIRILEKELKPLLSDHLIQAIYFYGAGCTPEKAPMVARILKEFFTESHVEVNSDLLGAARSLCGNKKGIACILGTGSNSCYYDGKQIQANISPLGYILGDEGSGAVLGKNLIGDLLKGQLSEELKKSFLEEYQLTVADILQQVYREPLPNRFLASFCPFLSANRKNPEIHFFLVKNFRNFFKRNVRTYHKEQLPVHIIGSIAYFFSKELKEAGEAEGLHIGRIEKSPMKGLVHYHGAK